MRSACQETRSGRDPDRTRAYYSPAMEATRPRRRRRRSRRGTVDSPLDTRLVRVSALVVAPALLALLFSISTPGILPPAPLEPLFDAGGAAVLADDLASEFPARVPGTTEATDAARWFEHSLAELGLETESHSWTESLPGLGRVDLQNIVAVVPGRSTDTIVVVAHRDNAGSDASYGDNASGTAALIELARGFAPGEAAAAPLPQRTLVLVSTDAGAWGGAGATEFASTSPYAERALAVVVLDGIGGPGRPRLALAGDRVASPGRALVSTVSSRIAEQVGRPPALPNLLTQLVDLGIPFALGEQGPFLARGIAALTITTREAGEPGVPAGDPEGPLAVERLGQLGRATEALIGSLDASVGASFRTPDSLFLGERAASGWAYRLLLVVAVVPFAIGVVDLLARGRRRGLPFRAAIRALRARLLFWAWGALLVWIGSLTGIFPTGASLPFPPYAESALDVSAAGFGLLVIAFAVGWLVERRRLVPTRETTGEERLAGAAVALAWLAAIAIVAAVAKPYALTFLLPSFYAWLWLPLLERRTARLAAYLLGLAAPAVALAAFGTDLGLDLFDSLTYLASLASVGYISLGTVLLTVAWLAAAAQMAAIASGRYAPYGAGREPPPRGVVRTSTRAVARRMHRRRYASGT
jgi:hypothetical protein